MRKLSAKQYAESLVDLTKGMSQKDIDALVRDCITLLARQGKAKILHQLGKELRLLCDREEGITRVKVVLAAQSLKEEKDISTQMYALLGKTIDITFSYDSALIGGMIITANDMVVDASISNQLERLRTALRS